VVTHQTLSPVESSGIRWNQVKSTGVRLESVGERQDLDNFIPLVIIQCIHLSGSGEMDSVSVKTGQAKGRTDS